ncbi:acylsugar acyltransferase 3-like [Bidens hawaiensis]|uniref:acylsugar acyltransferase 3-like n=1 Tax=Bidens hawaiensis TaxID=980011 RepID=UPI00404A0B46
MSPHIDCNDEGVVFVEAKHDSQMNMSQHISDEDDIVAQLYVDGMFWEESPKGATILRVQVNHFACGGIAVTMSLSHKIGDGCTLGSFVSHWASVARYGSTDHKEVLSLNPHFVQHPAITNVSPEVPALQPSGRNVVTRSKFVPKLPKTAIGNFIAYTVIKTRDESETSLSVLIFKIKKHKIEHDRLQNVQLAHEWLDSIGSSVGNEELENVANRFFLVSSLCELGYNKVDFGWGNPAVASMTSRPGNRVGFYLMDTPNGDGIEAWATLETEHMERFRNDRTAFILSKLTSFDFVALFRHTTRH